MYVAIIKLNLFRLQINQHPHDKEESFIKFQLNKFEVDEIKAVQRY